MKRLITLAGVLFLLLALALPAWATIAVVNHNGTLSVTLDNSNNFAWASATVTSGTGSGTALTTLFPNGLQITKINVNLPSGAVVSLRDGISTAPFIPPSAWTLAGGGVTMEYYLDGRWYTPSAFFADQTTPNGAVIDIEYSN